MPWVGFEPTIPASERAKTVHATATGTLIYYWLISCGGVGWDWVHLVRRPLFGLLYQPRIIDDVECGAVSGIKLAGETEVLGENLSQCQFVHLKSHVTWPGIEFWPPRWCQNDACLRECLAAPCTFPWNYRKPLRKPIVTMRRPLLHLIVCAIWRWLVSWKLNVMGLTLQNIFNFFITRNHTVENWGANFFSSCVIRLERSL
jgi:hypothetical protein